MVLEDGMRLQYGSAYNGRLCIEKQKDGRYALVLWTNLFTASMPSSYIFLGYIDSAVPLVQLNGLTAMPCQI